MASSRRDETPGIVVSASEEVAGSDAKERARRQRIADSVRSHSMGLVDLLVRRHVRAFGSKVRIRLRARGRDRSEWARAVARRILDGELEVEDGNRFVSGPPAYSVLGITAALTPPTHTLAQLSVDAVRYGESLRLRNAVTLGARLYFFNRQPVTPSLVRRLPGTADVLAFLGLEPGGRTRRALTTRWRTATPSGKDPWVVVHSRRDTGRRPSLDRSHKVYISPALDRVPDALRATIEVLNVSPALRFKIGSTVRDLLRPDKMVVYVENSAQRDALAVDLDRALAGIDPHGVPFTAPISSGSLISWGVDPPLRSQVPNEEMGSWRLWVTRKLAQYLNAAARVPIKHADPTLTPWQFALARLELDGVNVSNWSARSWWTALREAHA